MSNRPLLAALALADGDKTRIALSAEYPWEYQRWLQRLGSDTLRGGDHAPRSMAAIGSGALVTIGAPSLGDVLVRIDGNEPEAGSRELVAALRSATARLLDSPEADHIQLRLERRIDSRLVLALLLDAGATNVTAMTNGEQDSQKSGLRLS